MVIQSHILEKLDWPRLTAQCVQYAKTEEGMTSCAQLSFLSDNAAIVESWQQIRSMKNIVSDGFAVPVDELPTLRFLLRAIQLGQILTGSELRLVYNLLEISLRLYSFADALKERYPFLISFRSSLLPLTNLQQKIRNTVAESGDILDSASQELARIRGIKKNARKKIEDKLTALIHKSELVSYLQDDFFTVRSDRYVIPLKLDCRGRIKGKIVDTSESGQTVFFEPFEIAAQNDELLDLELQEKLEILKILKMLSQHNHERSEDLLQNYETIIQIDILTAKAKLAFVQKAEAPQISDVPLIDLKHARHPLLVAEEGRNIVANSISTLDHQHVLIISGPNAGGKTVVLKTVGLIHLMAKAGLLLPLAPESQIYNFQNIYLEMGDLQSLASNLSTFSAHLQGLKPIISEATANDLVLLDELCVGTEPQTGSALAQAFVERLADKGIKTVVTTHFDNLKALASHEAKYRNGSMEYSLKNYSPTFKLLWDIPGQSFGIELAQQMGLPADVLRRARELRGSKFAELDTAINEYLKERDKLKELEFALAAQTRDLQMTKEHFEAERENINIERQKISKRYAEIYEEKLEKLEEEFFQKLEELKRAQKAAQKGHKNTPTSGSLSKIQTSDILGSLDEMRTTMKSLSRDAEGLSILPGKKVEPDDLKIGDIVWVIPLQKEASVIRLPQKADDSVELKMGIIKLNSAPHDLRFLRREGTSIKHGSKSENKHKKSKIQNSPESSQIPLTLKTATNTIDVRGLDRDSAREMMISMTDKALMRGEYFLMIIHGHGTGTLKSTVREMLSQDFPYSVSFRPGGSEEGGDGVTIVRLNA